MAGAKTRPAISGYTWIFLGALLLRGCYWWEAFRNNELMAHPIADARVYVDWARDIAAGKWLWLDAMHYSPAVPAWFAGWIVLFGWVPSVHFAFFHLIGAVQAVLLGKAAEWIWDRRAGLATGWLAALYWPFVVFEGSYYAEPFAIWNLTLALFLLVRWLRKDGSIAWLLWAGVHLALSILARANAVLCLPVLMAAAVWKHWPQRIGWARWSRAAAICLVLAGPLVLLAAPIVHWNLKLTGRSMLRTGGWMNVYLGNNPAYHGLIVPLGIRWEDFVYQPVRAGFTIDAEQEDYWRRESLRVIRQHPVEWCALLPRKLLMLAGRFEVCQEIDVAIFRQASRVLALPIWPGWGTVAPLALVALLAMWRREEPRCGVVVALCAGAYLVSILPVQVSVRFRLPAVVPLLPLAGWALNFAFGAVMRRDAATIRFCVVSLAIAGLLIWPDWLSLGRLKIINHSFLVGLKRSEDGDEPGARKAFAEGALWNPADPDCPLRMAQIDLRRGDIASAKVLFARSRANFPSGHVAILGLGECALAEGHPDETIARAEEVLKLAPNNLEALDLASRASSQKQDWTTMALLCRQMRTYLTYPASVAFSEAWAWIRAGKPDAALAIYDMVAGTVRFSLTDRTRALFLAGAVSWTHFQNRTGAERCWGLIVRAPENFFQPLAGMLMGHAPVESMTTAIGANAEGRPGQYVIYAEGVKAWMDGRIPEARNAFERVVQKRNARQLLPHQIDILEVLALQDLEKLPAP